MYVGFVHLVCYIQGAPGWRSPKTLAESAQEYEAKQTKRHFDQVTVVTGEENESNVLQVSMKESG